MQEKLQEIHSIFLVDKFNTLKLELKAKFERLDYKLNLLLNKYVDEQIYKYDIQDITNKINLLYKKNKEDILIFALAFFKENYSYYINEYNLIYKDKLQLLKYTKNDISKDIINEIDGISIYDYATSVYGYLYMNTVESINKQFNNTNKISNTNKIIINANSKNPSLQDFINTIPNNLQATLSKKFMQLINNFNNDTLNKNNITQVDRFSELLPTTCSYCRALHGKRLDIDSVDAIIPSHPNCYCWKEPVINVIK